MYSPGDPTTIEIDHEKEETDRMQHSIWMREHRGSDQGVSKQNRQPEMSRP
jgi:hypothetical protein